MGKEAKRRRAEVHQRILAGAAPVSDVSGASRLIAPTLPTPVVTEASTGKRTAPSEERPQWTEQKTDRVFKFGSRETVEVVRSAHRPDDGLRCTNENFPLPEHDPLDTFRNESFVSDFDRYDYLVDETQSKMKAQMKSAETYEADGPSKIRI